MKTSEVPPSESTTPGDTSATVVESGDAVDVTDVPVAEAGRFDSPGPFDIVLLGGWIGFWALVDTHQVFWALAVQGVLSFGCSVAYVFSGRIRFAIGSVISLLPLLSGVTPYGHATVQNRIMGIALLQLLAIVLLVRNRPVRDAVRATFRGPTRATALVHIERTMLLGAALCIGAVLHQANPPLVIGLHQGETARNAAVLAVAFVVQLLTFQVLQFAATRPWHWYWTVLAQFVTIGACFASSRSLLSGFVAGAIGAGLAAYRIRDNALWPVAVGQAIVLALVCLS